jgi:DNA primase
MEKQFNCPFCPRNGKTRDTKKHLHVNPIKNKAHCFRCGYSSLNAKRMAEIERLDIEPSLWVILNDANQPARPSLRLPAEYTTEWRRILWGPQAYDYLRRRGLSDMDIAVYEIGHCSSGYFAQRVIVPVYDNGDLVYFQARDWTGRAPIKYLGPSGYEQGVLFNFDRAAESGVLLLVEGIFDALRLPAYAVALLGKRLQAQQQARIVAAKPRTVFIFLDSDADEQAERIKGQLVNPSRQVHVLRLPGIKDLGEAPADVVDSLDDLCATTARAAARHPSRR